MTTVLSVLGVLAVLFVVAAVALRDEAVLVEAPPDRADLALPDVGPVTAGDLAQLRFGMALRGYRMSQVDAVLDRLAEELLERDEQLAALSSEVDRLRARPPVDAPTAAYQRPVAAPEQDGPGDPGLVAAAVALPSPHAVAGAAVEAEPAGQTGSVLLTADQTVLETEPPVEHVPDSGDGAEPLPGVRTLPDASPPDAVPFPEPVHTDEPVRAPDQPDGLGTLPARGGARTQPAVLGAARDVAVLGANRALHLARRLQSRLVSARRPG